MGFQQVILTELVHNLGAEADVVKVRRGFARNFLIPRGKALEVTAGSLRRINSLKARRAQREAQEQIDQEELGRRIARMNLSFVLETGEGGKAFGSVTAKDILDRLNAEMPENQLARHAVNLESPIKTTGEHSVEVRLQHQVVAAVRVIVKAPEVVAPEADAGERRPRTRR